MSGTKPGKLMTMAGISFPETRIISKAEKGHFRQR